MTTPTEAPRVRLPIPDGVQMTLLLDHAGQRANVVVGGVKVGTGVFTPAGAAGWRDAFWNAFRPLCVNTVVCVGAIVRDVSVPDGLTTEVGVATSSTGSATGIEALGAAATLVRWKTARGGRSGKGRSYLPGFPQSQVGNDFRSPGTVHKTAVENAVATYIANGSALRQNVGPAVLSFTKGEASLIIAGDCGPIIGVQRRRMRG